MYLAYWFLLILLVLHRPHVTRHNLPQSLAGIEQVVTVRLLGVIFQSSLSFAAHVDHDHSMMHSEDMSSNYLTAYTHFTSNLSL